MILGYLNPQVELKVKGIYIMNNNLNRAWAEIDLNAIEHNISEIKKITQKGTEIMGIVKADAYGHGIIEVARTLLNKGITRLGVAVLDEAIQLRNSGIGAPILVLGYTCPERAEEIVINNITQTVYDYDLPKAISNAAIKYKMKAKVHVKVDTGMTRIGVMPNNKGIDDVLAISRLPYVKIEGLFTHFACADERDKNFTHIQFDKFMNFNRELEKSGICVQIKHVCNSAGIIKFPEMHLSMVRPGIILYGLYPSKNIDSKMIRLKPAMALKAKITMVKEIKEGTYIGYGRTYRTPHSSKVATIPIGYGDGYSRLLSNRGKVLVHGEEASIIGKICMDQCMADITGIKKDIYIGDEVVLFGKQGEAEICIEQIAAELETINYEVACMIGKRIPRIYMRDGKISKVFNCLI
jgi:alanine racemase